jgi:hypothetical protein
LKSKILLNQSGMSIEDETFLGTSEEDYHVWEENWPTIEHVDTNSIHGLVEINALTTEIFFNNKAFSRYHTILGEGEEERKAVKNAIGIHDFPAEETINPEQYKILLEGAHVKEQFARSYILRHVSRGSTFGLESWELDVLTTSCRIAGEFDAMCFLWRDEVQHGNLNVKAKELANTQLFDKENPVQKK